MHPPSPPRGVFVGLATLDISYVVDRIPGPNTKLPVAGQQIAAGGPAANAAATFAFLGGRTRLVSAFGRHPLAAVIRQDLEGLGVALHDLAAERGQAPPVSSILVLRATGQRTVISPRAQAFAPLNGEIEQRCFDDASILLVDGHYMDRCIAAARLARSRHVPVVLDSGSWKDGMDELLRSVDVAICSDDFHPPGCSTDHETLAWIQERGIGRVAITRGAGSILYGEDGDRGVVEVAQVEAVDTLGAGDIFHGAFCYAACSPGAGFRDSLAFAARVATFSCGHYGTRLWMAEFSKAESR